MPPSQYHLPPQGGLGKLLTSPKLPSQKIKTALFRQFDQLYSKMDYGQMETNLKKKTEVFVHHELKKKKCSIIYIGSMIRENQIHL
jgi:hypothetical protein